MMRELTHDEKMQLDSMQASRAKLNADLPKVAGLMGNGLEAKFRDLVNAEYNFRESLGEKGIMR